MNWLKRLFGKQKQQTVVRTESIDESTKRIRATKNTGGLNDARYTDKVNQIKQLKREEKHDEAIKLLLECVETIETELRKSRSKPPLDDKFAFLREGRSDNVGGVAPWYYEQLAIIYRKERRYDDEVRILERYQNQSKAPGKGPEKLAERLEKARQLVAKSK